LLGATARADAAGGGYYYSGPPSDHFDGQRFFNPGEDQSRGFGDFLRWQLTKREVPWPESSPSPFRDTPPSQVGPRDLRISLVGHATFLIQMGGFNILTDPVWSGRASPFAFAGPRRHNPPGIPFDRLPRIDMVLISHNHYDHMDLPTIVRLWERDQPRVIAPLGNDSVIRAQAPAILVEGRWTGEIALRSVPDSTSSWSRRITGRRGPPTTATTPSGPPSSSEPLDDPSILPAIRALGAAGISGGQLPVTEILTSPCCRSGPMSLGGSWLPIT
jgi:hypothetical protein